jgi:uncharacterized protein Usg
MLTTMRASHNDERISATSDRDAAALGLQWLLQTYVWQDFDLFPKFPELNKFLNFWTEKLDGPLHSVMVAHARLIKPAKLNAIDGEFRLH